jgi:hypothetical protein
VLLSPAFRGKPKPFFRRNHHGEKNEESGQEGTLRGEDARRQTVQAADFTAGKVLLSPQVGGESFHIKAA